MFLDAPQCYLGQNNLFRAIITISSLKGVPKTEDIGGRLKLHLSHGISEIYSFDIKEGFSKHHIHQAIWITEV